MSKTSAEVKNRYNKKNYDAITFAARKGCKDILKAAARQSGKSMGRYITDAINDYAGEILLPPLDDDSKEKKSE